MTVAEAVARQLQDLPRATPESQGVDSRAIISLVDALEAEQLGLHGIMVLRHGRVLAEGWWHPYEPDLRHSLFSVSKTFTATAIGIAQDEGLLSVDEPLLNFFPSLVTPSISARLRDVRLRDLLSMSFGHDFDTVSLLRALPESDWVDALLQVPLAFPPGEVFVYNSGASFLLATAIFARTGQSVRDYLIPRLFEPLGLGAPHWETNSRGLPLGWTGLSLTTEELARFGQLYLQRGRWGDRQLVSAEWVDAASTSHVDNAVPGVTDDWAQGYGYQLWLSRHASYRFDGAFGQFALVLPEQDMVVAITAGTVRGRGIPAAVWTHLLPGVTDAPLSEDAIAAEALATRVDSLGIPVPDYLPQLPALAARISGRRIELPANSLRLASVVVRAAETTELECRTVDGEVEVIRADRLNWVDGRTELVDYEEIHGARTATVGGWLDERTLEIRQQLVETPFARVWTLRFDDPDHPVVGIRLDPGPWIERVESLASTLC